MSEHAYDIYNDIQNRTGGNIYIGIVGPARTGKSTFIRTDVTTEIAPVVDSKEQSENLVRYLKQEVAEHPEQIWDTNIFGRTLYEIVTDQSYQPPFQMGV